MALMDAKPYDERRARIKRNIIIAVVVLVVVGAVLAFFLRHYPETRAVNRFFAALQQQNYEQAYGVWVADPDWKQHPDKYSNYTYGQFYSDWGPGGEYGKINAYDVEAAVTTQGGTGVIVGIKVNDRAEKAFLYVNRQTKELSFSPVRLEY